MIGINRLSSGRLGNRLLHYHFLRQISRKLESDYFHPLLPESKVFEDMGWKPKIFPTRLLHKINQQDLIALKSKNLLSFLKDKLDHGYTILLEPPILGDLFFETLYYPPSDFLKVKSKYKIPFSLTLQTYQVLIGIHFRGGDFQDWNHHAALKFEYYKQAIEYCQTYFHSEKVAYLLFSDDLTYLPYQKTLEFLKQLNIYFETGNTNGLPIYDFYQISQCDVLISSPSTFAIISGALGKCKKIIHCKTWLDYTITQNDLFWVGLTQSNNPHYRLWKSI